MILTNERKLQLFLILDCLLMLLLKYLTNSYFGWETADFSDGQVAAGVKFLAIVQFIFFAASIDQLAKIFITRYNASSDESKISQLFAQVISINLYFFVGLLGFVLLYDHSFKHLIATSSIVGLGLAYIFRDILHDVVSSIVIQYDGMISINDWIEVRRDGQTEFFQVTQLNSRLITLRDKYDYHLHIHNSEFLHTRFINISKQHKGRGSRRELEIELDSSNNPETVRDILSHALRYLVDTEPHFRDWYFCDIVKIKYGYMVFVIQYECSPSITLAKSSSLVMGTAWRFLKAYGINTSCTYQVEQVANKLTDSNHPLLDIYSLGVLRVLNLEEIVALTRDAKVIHCDAGSQLIREGEVEETMFLVSEGLLEVKLHDESSSETVAVLQPGDCVGEMSLLTGKSRSADVYAKTNAVLIQIHKDNLAPLFESNPHLIKKLSEILAQRSIANESFKNRKDEQSALIKKQKSIAKEILRFFMGVKS